MNNSDNEQNAFNEVKKSLESAMEEIKKQSPALYEHLIKSIIMDEDSKSFGYFPD